MSERPVTGTWFDDPSHFVRPSRREFLRVGVLGSIGLTLGDLFRLEAEAAEPGAGVKAKSVIQIHLGGGMSHMESFDPHPFAPIEYRGDLGTVKTALPGEEFAAPFAQTAAVAKDICVIRSMTHGEAAHERGTHNMLTGYRPSPAITFPSMGSVVAHQYGPRNNLPPYVCVPGASDPFLGTGYLSSAYGPFSLGGDPVSQDFSVQDLSVPAGIAEPRFKGRRGLLDLVDRHFSQLEKSDNLDAMSTFYQRAYALISSPQAREAFNIKAEPDAVRNEYGRTGVGQRCLMARRLVEAGVRFVTVLEGGWDMHIGITNGMRALAPQLDQGFATLIRDLKRRGLLQSTLVLITSEFGRTARINKDAGRDHWPKVFSIVMAGGGIKSGLIYGSSDAYGAEPDTNPIGPPDMAATLFTLLGIRPEDKLMSPGNRPIDIVRNGTVIKDVMV